MPRKPQPVPNRLVQDWPTRVSADPIVEYARRLALNVENALDAAGLTMKQAEGITGVSDATLGQLVRGAAWPTLPTIAKLETTLHVSLWPGEDILAGLSRITSR